MPIITPSRYRPPALLGNPHLQTICPTLFRRVSGVRYRRERIFTPDGDFIDLDWSTAGADRLAIVLHGLEGDAHRHYMLGMVRAFNRRGWDALAFNFRGCSGEPNRLPRSYHSGATEDLETVLGHVLAANRYRRIALVGFSLGGNLTLRYLGEKGRGISPFISRAAAISVPCDLASSSRRLAEPANAVYMKRFLLLFRAKIRAKMALMPDRISDAGFETIRNFKDFDDRYTAPLHGFRDAEDYWARCSAGPLLPEVRVPTLLLSALDDPFLPPACYPVAAARANPRLFLEMPAAGGHVGFIRFCRDGEFWHETRVADFATAG